MITIANVLYAKNAAVNPETNVVVSVEARDNSSRPPGISTAHDPEMNHGPALSGANVLRRAARLIDDYARLTGDLPREKKGIRQSEMFFLYAAVTDLKPARILESGRARGQSTLILGHCFHEARILSVERDELSPDVPIARERLKHLNNVACVFGDARVLLPQLVEPGDIVLIDGPKGFRALKLAFKLLNTGKPAAVFVHDLWLGLPERRFLQRHVPRAFFSDDPEFVRRYFYLDRKSSAAGPHQTEPPSDIESGYGATLACIPAGPLSYHLLLVQVTAARLLCGAREMLAKLFSQPTAKT
jgi:hypothetical protein